jgi:hypothetical protein
MAEREVEIDWEFLPHQAAAWEASEQHDEVALVTGVGGGKSWFGARWLLARALSYPDAVHLATGNSYPQCRDVVVPNLLAAAREVEEFVGHEWKQGTFDLHLDNGGKVLVRSTQKDHVDKLRGIEIGSWWSDETRDIDPYAVDVLVGRLRDPSVPSPKYLWTTTPSGFNVIYQRHVVEGASAERSLVQGTTRDNPFLPDGYIDKLLASYDARMAQQELEGAFVSLAEGLVYHAFDPAENVVEIEMPRDAELGAGMDFNVDPMSAVVFWRRGRHMHVIAEVEQRNSDTESLCHELRERWGPRAGYTGPVLHNVYPDASGNARKTAAPEGKTDFWFIRQAGFEIRAPWQNPKRRDRYNAVNSKFKARNGEITLTIDPACEKLQQYLVSYTHENRAKAGEPMSHLLDAFSYPVSFLYPVNREAMSWRT